MLKPKDMIVIGKTNMDEFRHGWIWRNSYYGPTKNAWDHSKVPGGSSSGSAAVASGQVRLSLGSIPVVLSANPLPSTGLLVSNQLMERFPVLVSLPLVAHLTKLVPSHQPLRKMPIA